MSEFLASGRRTRFSPSRVAERPQLDRSAAEMKVSPAVARDMAEAARGLLQNKAVVAVLHSLASAAYDSFEGSPPGPTGSEQRDLAHMKIRALELIVEQLRSMEADAALYDKIEKQEAEHD